MKNENRFLHEVLNTEDHDRFLIQVEGQMIAELRRRKRASRQKWLAMAASVAFMLALSVWLRPGPMQQPQPAASAIIHNERFSVEIVRTSPGGFDLVQTQAGVEFAATEPRPVELLSDAALLALFHDRPVALLRHGTEATLVFPEQELK